MWCDEVSGFSDMGLPRMDDVRDAWGGLSNGDGNCYGFAGAVIGDDYAVV